jgi:phosphatidylserine/phosphatidylglycerophosphate/cardiolipin synthase-like enzyme
MVFRAGLASTTAPDRRSLAPIALICQEPQVRIYPERASNLPRVFFGGPDRPYQFLRDALEELVEAAPPGSQIDWATYYFRDNRLASALMRASDRGVEVRVVVEPSPRLRNANERTLSLLQEHGLAGGLRFRPRFARLGQLHSKAYVFSHPHVALVGSFNPSSNGTPDDIALGEIGDQDRGYNLLLCLCEPELVLALRRHVAWLAGGAASPLDRFRPRLNRQTGHGATKLFFYPRLRTRLVERDIAALRRGDRVTAAVSHMKPGGFIAALGQARANGVEVDLFAHSTERRVPTELVKALTSRGLTITRVGDGERVPMHNKFVVLSRGSRQHAWLGSYNYNAKSRWLNDELLVRTDDPETVEALQLRFDEMKKLAAQVAGNAVTSEGT